MSRRTLMSRVAIVDVAAQLSISIDVYREYTADAPPSCEHPQARRPLLHHLHRRCGIYFRPHARPGPRRIVRSDL